VPVSQTPYHYNRWSISARQQFTLIPNPQTKKLHTSDQKSREEKNTKQQQDERLNKALNDQALSKAISL
jgi:hypothetical protein